MLTVFGLTIILAVVAMIYDYSFMGAINDLYRRDSFLSFATGFIVLANCVVQAIFVVFALWITGSPLAALGILGIFTVVVLWHERDEREYY